MTEDMLVLLRAIDPTMLNAVVRQDQNSNTFELLDWTVKRLSDKGIINPDGLFLFSGHGRDEQGVRPWSVVLKVLKGSHDDDKIGDMFYWKREYLLVQSGMLATLPDSITVPRFYGVVEQVDGGWVWMEHIVENVNSKWTMDQYVFAARQVGHFNAQSLLMTPKPDFPWLCRSFIRDWLSVAQHFRNDQNPFVVNAFSSELLSRVAKLWDAREHWIVVLEQLPQVFSHSDANRRNLMIRRTGEGRDELVAIDWALCGYGALGCEAVNLIGDNILTCEIEPQAFPELEAAVFPAFLEGLRDGGWQGDPDRVRLAYLIQSALFLGAAAPSLVVAWTGDSRATEQSYRRSPDVLAATWASMCELALDRGDEALKLMDKLGF